MAWGAAMTLAQMADAPDDSGLRGNCLAPLARRPCRLEVGAALPVHCLDSGSVDIGLLRGASGVGTQYILIDDTPSKC